MHPVTPALKKSSNGAGAPLTDSPAGHTHFFHTTASNFLKVVNSEDSVTTKLYRHVTEDERDVPQPLFPQI